MFDVLVYLFHNYYTPDACPPAEVLAKRLAAAGFEHDDIHQALGWLLGLAESIEECVDLSRTETEGTRFFAAFEQQRLGTEAMGFITFLENSGALAAPLREIVIERALACHETPVSMETIKIIALMVLWSQEAEVDRLILEELLLHDGERPIH